jgi:hypothetical protein
MNEIEKGLYALMEAAAEQQASVNVALAALEQQQIELAKTTVQLQTLIGEQLVPAVQKAAIVGAAQAVKKALENASQIASAAVAESCQPLLVGMAGVATQATAAEAKIKGAVQWFGWRWAGLAGSIAFGAILALGLATWGMVWWQRGQLADLKAEREKITHDVAAAQSMLAVLEKRTGGVRYAEGSEGRFILVRKGFEKHNCVGNVPCIRLK